MTDNDSSPLVSCEWLMPRLAEPEIAVLDATFFLPRQQRDAYDEYRHEHLPGAGFFDIDRIADRDSPLPHMLPAASQFAEAVGRLGINNKSLVVVYDRNGFTASARAWWTFRVFGHDRIKVLDGGLARWNQLGGPVTSAASTARPRQFQAAANPELVCTIEQMMAIVERGERLVLDARSPARFAGTEPEPRPGLRAGHIPGSHNLHYAKLVDSKHHTLRPLAELTELYCKAGVQPGRPLVTTCGSGVTAAILALGLYCLGRRDVPVYDGSWSEWGGRHDTPIENER